MLEEKKNMIYLSITNGEIQRWMGKDQPLKTYGKVGGFITGISSDVRTFDGEDVKFIFIRMKDDEENYSVQVPMFTSAGPDIIRCLSYAAKNRMDFVNEARITIEVYQKLKEGKSFTNASLYFGQAKLEWLHLPNGVTREQGLEQMLGEVKEYINGLADYNSSNDSVPSGGYHESPFDRHA